MSFSRYAYSGDYSLGYFYASEIGLGFHDTFSGHRLEGTYYNGTDKGMLFGVGYASEHREYINRETTKRTSYLDIKYPFMQIGYWKKIRSSAKLSGFANLGYGDSKYRETAQADITAGRMYSFDLGCRLFLGYDLAITKIDLIGGLGISTIFDRFDEVDESGFLAPYLLVGIAIRF